MELLALFVAVAALACGLAAAIAVAGGRLRIRRLESRISSLEAALASGAQSVAPAAPVVEPPSLPEAEVAPAPPPAPDGSPAVSETAELEHLEAVIGQKWLGWVAILLIFCAAGFFLKYAFENRWIGGRSRNRSRNARRGWCTSCSRQPARRWRRSCSASRARRGSGAHPKLRRLR
jgi:hypothetical protein